MDVSNVDEDKKKIKNATPLYEVESGSDDDDKNIDGLLQARYCYSYSINRRNYIVPNGLYCELLINPPIFTLPNSSPHLCGLINVRGNLVPVYKLYDPEKVSMGRVNYVIMMGAFPNAAAVCVDSKATPIAERLLEKASGPLTGVPNIFQEFIVGMFKCEQKLYFEVDHNLMFEMLKDPLRKFI